MKVNIGKSTLGGGNKMSLNMREYGRSTHDLSYAWRSTMGVGVLTPFMRMLALPGDTFEINMDSKILTAPTIGPLFGSFKFQADLFTCPIRLYNAMLHNNTLNIGLDMSKVKLPKVLMYRDMKNEGQNKYFMGNSTSSIKNLLEYRTAKKLNAVPLLAYYDIFKNYYANKQEGKFYMYSGETVNNQGFTASGQVILKNDPQTGVGMPYLEVTYNKPPKSDWVLTFTDQKGIKYNSRIAGMPWDPNVEGTTDKIKYYRRGLNAKLRVQDVIGNDPAVGSGGSLNNLLKTTNCVTPTTNEDESIRKIEAFDLEQIDNLRDYILSKGKTEVVFDEDYLVNDFLKRAISSNTTKEVFGGLCLKTYQSDINNNWINAEWVEGENGISNLTKVDTSGGSFSIDTLNLAKKVYEMLNRIAISGGTYKDWIETVYTTDYYFRAETPVYEGGMSSEIEFEEIVSNSASEADGYEPLGTLAGRGINTTKKGGNIIIKVNEPCYIMGICSITPRVDYSQGQPFDLELDTLDDIHKPQLDGIGYEDRMLNRLDWRASSTESLGKQPAWIEYTTNINKTFGLFAAGESQEYMVLNRIYEFKVEGKEGGQSSYIDPSLYNKIFATTGNQEQNFWVQIGCGIKARRVMSARQIPNF